MGFPENSREGFTTRKEVGQTPWNPEEKFTLVSDLQVLGLWTSKTWDEEG